jgi:pyruvate/2-oxoglutarate dehydrogenase complex dihydrolipoamide dehydrogenase (E3) component
VGCIPTKAQVGSAKAIHTARRGDEFGFRIRDLEVDWPEIRARKDRIVDMMRNRLERKLDEHPDIDLIRGSARFSEPGQIIVGDDEIRSTKFILASGVAPVIPDIPGLAEVGFETNETVMDMTRLPESMVVVGGGPEGMEFAQILHRLGVRVRVLQRRDRVLPAEDVEVSDIVEAILREEGIDIRTSTEPVAVESTGRERVSVTARAGGKHVTFECERILVAAGRRPHDIGDMDLNAAGIEADSETGVVVDPTLKTTAADTWAMGDVIGRVQFTHFAVYTAGIAVDNALGSAGRRFDTTRVPGAVFTDPEVASVGLTEQSALATGRRIKVGRQLFRRVGRAIAVGETKGFVKVVVDADSHELLGLHLVGHMAGDLLTGGMALLHTSDRTIDPLVNSLIAHPTLSEGVKAALTSLEPAAGIATPAGDVAD